jgi:2,3-bisphosphoglycerate-independent phosphoglycerate mutase
MQNRKVILVIRDGWGYRSDGDQNALAEVPTPYTDALMKEYPNTLLEAAGNAVGLPQGYQGNSEVGHLTIGSGRIILQSLERINRTIADGSFFEMKDFVNAIKDCKHHGTKLHLIGLLQVEGVHSHLDHLFALLDLCHMHHFREVYIHAITDGRDSPVHDSVKHVKKLAQKLQEIGFGTIATISGRYYAMDRDKRWERTKKYYDCIVQGDCEGFFSNALDQIESCHQKNETDEFIIPRKVMGYEGLQKNDAVIFFNFRTDRPRQITQAIVEEEFEGWKRKKLDVNYITMTQYYTPMNAHVIFKDEPHDELLGEVISNAGLKQFRISETEKYAHVTYFFNGQIEKPYPNEDRLLIDSPKVATYDLKPEMSVYEVTEKLIEKINTEMYDFIVVNMVNGDMVGHTGITEAIHKAVHAVDECLGRIAAAGLEKQYTLVIAADHGNVEDQREEWRTSHTLNPVPCILVSGDTQLRSCKLKQGRGLQDIAPTALEIMGLEKPWEMTGESLIEK